VKGDKTLKKTKEPCNCNAFAGQSEAFEKKIWPEEMAFEKITQTIPHSDVERTKKSMNCKPTTSFH